MIFFYQFYETSKGFSGENINNLTKHDRKEALKLQVFEFK